MCDLFYQGSIGRKSFRLTPTQLSDALTDHPLASHNPTCSYNGSQIDALDSMGYTYLYAQEMDRALQLYSLFPDLVKMVLMEQGDVFACFEDKITCQKNEDNPDGIPLWKIFAFYFWADTVNPLGPRWTLAPEIHGSSNAYVGYSVEKSCLTHSFIPHEDRFDQAYLFAKRMSYFSVDGGAAWDLELFDAAKERSGVHFIAGADDDSEDRPDLNVPETLGKSVWNYGILPQDSFVDAVAHSRVLVGVGNPVL